MSSDSDTGSVIVNNPEDTVVHADDAKLVKEGASLYQCVFCNKFHRSVPGKKIGFNIEETLGKLGPICPDCESKQ